MSNKKTTDIYHQIKLKCMEHNISIKELCKEIGISDQTLYNWKHKSPDALDTYFKIINFFEGLEGNDENED